MALIKKNIWFLFYLMLCFSIALFIVISYLTWKNVYQDYKTEQENIVKILANTTHSLLTSQELILDIIGDRFYNDETYKDFDKARKTLSQLTKLNPSIIAFGLANTEGKLIFISSQKKILNLPNLKTQAQSRDSFMDSLTNSHMVLGRTYHFKPLQQYVVPIRKAIRDEKGNVVSVMTAALNIQGAFGRIKQSITDRDQISFALIRGNDLYTQYNSILSSEASIYNEPVKKEVIESSYSQMSNTYNLSIDQIQNQEKIVSIIIVNKYYKDMLLSAQYDNIYNLWVIVQNEIEAIKSSFMKIFLLYLTIFVPFISALLYFVRLIANADKKRNAELLHQATHDEISMLPNRNYLKRHIDDWFSDLNRPFSLFNIDMDKFKNVNDTLGHEAGDKILKEIALRLKSCVVEDTLIVRYGGDEFILLVKESSNTKLIEYAQKILDTLSQPYPVEKFYFTLGASIGIAKFPQDGNTFDALMRAGDIAMYEAKKKRNSASIFANSLQEGYLRNIQIEQALRDALKNDEFHMVYQPQFTQQGQLHGVEALIRWKSKELGFIPPDQFISIAESSGMMGKLGHFIIETSLKEIQEAQKESNICFQLSINISLKQFMEKTFLDHLLKTLDSIELCSPASLTLEVTESLFIDDIEYILPLLHKIKEHGMEISMDDFGTGYSSLSVLKGLPIDELKIDKSFVDDILEDKMAKKMIKNIIDIGRNLDMRVLAEGVETLEQKELLTKLKCDCFQGYYFAKPLTKADLLLFLKNNL